MKRVLMLGGNFFQVTAIKAAKELGCHVISVDYLPDNPGHKYADEYYNISTVDRDAVLSLARKLNIDGIVSYASDVSAPTAAYVAEQMNLPTNPLKSVEILTDKQKFRQFLKTNNFNVPNGDVFTDFETAKKYIQNINSPVIVKPTDSSGSKGVHRVDTIEEFECAWHDAKRYSRNHRIFVEEYIQKAGYEIDADSFWMNDQFLYFGVMDQHNDLQCSPYTPIGLSGPSVLDLHHREIAKNELTRLMRMLNMHMGACNIEYIFDKNKNFYILEVGPRNGGNLITDTIKFGTGVDLAKYTVLAAIGEDCNGLRDIEFTKNVSSYIIHAPRDGIYQNIWISDEIKNNILRLDMFVKPGDKVKRFDNASKAIGAAIIQFPTQAEMCEHVDNMERWIKVELCE